MEALIFVQIQVDLYKCLYYNQAMTGTKNSAYVW
ncbi:hypothetical protein [Flavonifractor phage Castelnaud]|nr:hypothetical protein [Flavonifractor phage Castelnaud]